MCISLNIFKIDLLNLYDYSQIIMYKYKIIKNNIFEGRGE